MVAPEFNAESTEDMSPARKAAKKMPNNPVGRMSLTKVAIALSASVIFGLCASAIIPGTTMAKGIRIFKIEPNT